MKSLFNKTEKTIFLCLTVILLLSLLSACGKTEVLGYYRSSDSSFPISGMNFYEDGTVDIMMGLSYSAEYKVAGDKVKLDILGPSTDIASYMYPDQSGMFDISCTVLKDGSLEVTAEVNKGYVYLGEDTVIFTR